MPPTRSPSFWLVLCCLVAAALGLVGSPEPARASDAAAPSASVAATRAPAAPSAAGPAPAGARADGNTNTLLYPPQSLHLVFDHRRHAGGLGLSCVYCHTGATTSRKAEDRLLPPASRCDACHGTNHDAPETVQGGVGSAKACSYCHAGYRAEDGPRVARTIVPPPNVRFDHSAHYARGISCQTCHGSIERQALATRADLPDMRTCTTCHRADAPPGLRAPAECAECHVTESGRRIRTHFAAGTLVPPAWLHGAEHGPDWIERHKVVAGTDSALCASCHAESECVDCHDGRVRPRRIHPNDWLTLHALSARQNGPSCTSCHRAQSFCIGCHERSGVTQSGPYANVADRGRFHPPKPVWTDPPRSAQHHSWEAERNITACVSCHTERDCALCHATASRGGRGGFSPHPPGFVAACRTAFEKNPRPCLYCHDPQDRSMGQCR